MTRVAEERRRCELCTLVGNTDDNICTVRCRPDRSVIRRLSIVATDADGKLKIIELAFPARVLPFAAVLTKAQVQDA